MNRIGKVLLSAAALGILAVSAIAWGLSTSTPPAGTQAQQPAIGPGPAMMRGGGNPMARIAAQLDLSDEQREQIRAILASARKDSEALRTQIKAMRGQIEQMIRDDNYYEDQARMLVESNSQAFVELAMTGIRTLHDIRAVLTPEQRAKADAMLDQWKARHARRETSAGSVTP